MAPSKLNPDSLTVGGVTPSFLSVEHDVLLMDCSYWTIRRWITSGQFAARKMPSGGLRIAVADLERIGEPVRPNKHPRRGAA